MTTKDEFEKFVGSLWDFSLNGDGEYQELYVAGAFAAFCQKQKEIDALKAEIERLKPAQILPLSISRQLLGKIVDEIFDGTIEDCSVIEDIYRVIAAHHREQP